MNPPREGASGVNLLDVKLPLLTTRADKLIDDISKKGPEVVRENLICFTPEGEY